MPRPLRVLLVLLSPLFAIPVLRAHEPLQSTVSVHRTGECLEVSAVLSPQSALLLLPEDRRPRVLLKENFPDHQEAFAAAAAQVCALIDTNGSVLAANRVLVTLNHEGEVGYLLIYPADAAPASLRMTYLDTQPAGAFCELADATTLPVTRLTLRKTRLVYAFAASSPALSSPSPRP